MDKINDAFQAWSRLAPFHDIVPTHKRTLEHPPWSKGRIITVKAHFDGNCCKRRDHNDADGNPLKDRHPGLCARELAWRIYTRLRDGITVIH